MNKHDGSGLTAGSWWRRRIDKDGGETRRRKKRERKKGKKGQIVGKDGGRGRKEG